MHHSARPNRRLHASLHRRPAAPAHRLLDFLTSPYWCEGNDLYVEPVSEEAEDQMAPGCIGEFNGSYTLRVPVAPVTAATTTSTGLGATYNNYEAKDGRIYGLRRSKLCFDLDEEEVQ